MSCRDEQRTDQAPQAGASWELPIRLPRNTAIEWIDQLRADPGTGGQRRFVSSLRLDPTLIKAQPSEITRYET